MINKSLLLISATVAVVLGFVQEIAEATCTGCDSSEENVLMQHKRQHKQQHKTNSSTHSCFLEINETQTAWAQAILNITKSYFEDAASGEYIKIAEKAIHDLYGYDIGTVMFKPTKAAAHPFRPTAEGALSYFVGYEAIAPKGFEEDGGFAINNGQGWSNVLINNSDISCVGDLALAHGYYFFTNRNTSDVVGVEYSWVYKKIDGKLKIIVHHSSIPFPMPPMESALMEEGVAWRRRLQGGPGYHRAHPHHEPYKPQPDCNKAIYETQTAWKRTILSISHLKMFRAGDDYIQVAEDEINELYGYDIGPVMFKPTKAAVYPFRPTFMGALSYFVGYEAIKPNGFKEDGGFAINNGNGWSKVKIVNDRTSCMGDYTFAQGYYYFTNAKDEDDVAEVEYTWVYKWMKNGKMKIILHHSSLPFNPN